MALGQEELGRRIKQAREEADLTQPELAERIGLKHPQSISNYERALTEVPTRRLRKIATETGKPLEFFLGAPPNRHTEGEDRWQLELLARMRSLEEREGLQEELLRELLRLAQAGEGSSQAGGE